MPAAASEARVVPRSAGVGSLGKPRVMAVGTWAGGRVVREVKRLTASACAWAADDGDGPVGRTRAGDLMARAVRSSDPVARVVDGWLVRRRAPDCDKVALVPPDGASRTRRDEDETNLLYAMGWEAANIHLGTPDRKRAILNHLKSRRRDWLLKHAEAMCDVVAADWWTWRRAWRRTRS